MPRLLLISICLLLSATWGEVRAQGVVSIVRNINPDDRDGNANISDMVAFNDMVVFSANDGVHGQELWRSDGTESGTVMVKNINLERAFYDPARESGAHPREFVQLNDILYFTASDLKNGRVLWRTDGSESGTFLVKDVNPEVDFTISNLSSLNGQLYFSADDGMHGGEVWVSDGSTEGTRLLVDINKNGSSAPSFFRLSNGYVYFRANDGVHGSEIWRTDGTEAGTEMVADINPDGDSNPYRFTSYRGSTYFTANDGINGFELWKTDGTRRGTRMIKNVATNRHGGVRNLIVVGNYLLFEVNNGLGKDQLWRTNGTKNGTIKIGIFDNFNLNGEISSYYLVVGNTLLFWADDGVRGVELWKTNGTQTGTKIVQQLGFRDDGSFPRGMTLYRTNVYFSAYTESSGKDLWRTRDDFSEIKRAKDIDPGGRSFVGSITAAGNHLFFKASTRQYGLEELFKLTAMPNIPATELLVGE